ncbi:MAG: MarR family transcriptional regulator [Jatrophihabitantaceae bacterium]
MTTDSERRLENLLGSLLTALSDCLTYEADSVVGHTGATAAALTYLVQEPGQGIEQMRRPLGLTQSATVRLVDRLAADGLVERRSGRNGRAIAVHLTANGELAARRILDRRHDVLRSSLVPLDPTERGAMTTMVEKILTSITTGPEHGERICRMCDLAACPTSTCPVNLAAEQRSDQADCQRSAAGPPSR